MVAPYASTAKGRPSFAVEMLPDLKMVGHHQSHQSLLLLQLGRPCDRRPSNRHRIQLNRLLSGTDARCFSLLANGIGLHGEQFMHRTQKLLDLIGDIHDASLDPALWTDVLSRIKTFVGARTCSIIFKNPVNRRGIVEYQVGFDPHYIQLYEDIYANFDPLKTLPPIGQVVNIPDLVPYDEYRRGPYFQEWLLPQDRADTAFVMLEKSATKVAILTLGPRKANAMVDAEMRRRITAIAPHARRAVLVGNTIELRQLEAISFADTLNGLRTGVFLVDVSGRLVHANAVARDLLYREDIFHLRGAGLQVRDPQVNKALREVFFAAANDDTAVAAKAIALPLVAPDGVPYFIHVLPLTSGERRIAKVASTAVAALFVRKIALDGTGSPEIIASFYKLTMAELRVLLAIVEVGGVRETAEALGIAEATVKTHLSRIFMKTGARRQADLVKIVAGFSSPLADQ
jgi:DNA-binding CsgD family transcriptional regulator/PAS domain-containing protein